jgi:hypothetical protein
MSFNFLKYESKVIKKLSKLLMIIEKKKQQGFSFPNDYLKQLLTVGGNSRDFQFKLLDNRIGKIHKEIKRLKNDK